MPAECATGSDLGICARASRPRATTPRRRARYETSSSTGGSGSGEVGEASEAAVDAATEAARVVIGAPRPRPPSCYHLCTARSQTQCCDWGSASLAAAACEGPPKQAGHVCAGMLDRLERVSAGTRAMGGPSPRDGSPAATAGGGGEGGGGAGGAESSGARVAAGRQAHALARARSELECAREQHAEAVARSTELEAALSAEQCVPPRPRNWLSQTR
eukprot:COSAG01_NODE_7049_length_3376_cov_32.391822_2_plen_217_part_00